MHRVRAVCCPRGGRLPPGLRPHKGDCAFIPVPSAPPPSPRRSLGPTAGRTLCKHRTRGRAAERRAAFRGQMPALPSLPPSQKGHPPNVSRHSPGTTPLPLRAGELPWLPRDGEEGEGRGAGPWGEGKARTEGAARATLRSGEKSWDRGLGGLGGGVGWGDVQAEAWAAEEEEEVQTNDRGEREDSGRSHGERKQV